ncbi:MAG: isocitrate/isopropylmalate dehydrogenase family protein [Chloroflexi bacterium]|nr:MAG: isocitrate/isopropylmalate dehydrogenase family protein [Chloroflexota bacterium]RLC95962.1 MAG: isocitrate/isopropylmalate dehydrogenase family protein [Chloroflexota bacterium]
MIHRVTLIPGDGVGPEVTAATKEVLEASGAAFDWEWANMGISAQGDQGDYLPERVLESIRRNKVALKGPVTTPVGSGFRSVNVALRRKLGLYACVRPCKSYRGAPSLHEDVDIVIIRENMEDIYCGIEFEKGSSEAARLARLIAETSGESVREDSGMSIKTISETGSRRIVRFAFEYARACQRRKVTAVHKANILKLSDGLFLSAARAVAKEYPDIEFEDRIVDNMCMQLVQRPREFDVVVAPNLYGDLLSDLCAGLIGGLGLAPGANLGDDMAVFEATHGSAPKYAGLNKMNPMAMMLSGAMMLRHLGEKAKADRVEEAIAAVIAEGKSVTYDLKPGAPDTAVTTWQVAEAVIGRLGHS